MTHVRAVLELLRGARTGSIPDPAFWVDGLSRIVGARQVVELTEARFAPPGRGRVGSLVTTFQHPGVSRMHRLGRWSTSPVAAALHERLRGAPTGAIVTVRRQELVDDATWYGSRLFQEHFVECGLDDFIYSVRRLGPGALHAFTLTRGLRETPFTVEERNLVDLFHAELVAEQAARDRTDGLALTPRQSAVLDELLVGRSEKEVASRLGIGVATVHSHVKALHRLFGVRSRAELIVRALGSRG